MTQSAKANRLIHATSPYLIQHAYNPVDWYEWGATALEKAVRENKPILVSIGYSSCHWCHVMEREVFEKDDIAAVMNEHLVCIKVDREERPDIDAIYMEAVQAMQVHGGWPLNVFLTPDQKPFYGGTYFPPDQWLQVIRGVANAFKTRKGDVEQSAEDLANALARQETSHLKKAYEFSGLKTDLDTMYAKLSPAFDKKWGGLDKAPKFVMPSVWLWLLRYHYLTGNTEALQQLDITLTRIAWGGIYDQVGGGFARYSVDAYWFVPHFEKMLYDNAQLLSLYAEAYAITKNELFRSVVVETFEWLQAEMTHPDGGFYSALDADSEGVEGKFYTWTKNEVDALLKDESPLFCEFYNIKDEGNWEHGQNIPIRTIPVESFLAKHQLDSNRWNDRLRKMKDTLLAARDKRIRPGLDDKIITSWNAMMISGLCDAYRYLHDERFLKAAVKAMAFVEKELIDGTTVYRSYKNKRSTTKGFLDDYAFTIQAYIRLYQQTFNETWIHKAESLMNTVLDQFHDQEDGFFFYTSRESEKLIARRKELFDNVIPCSNSVMVQNLYHLGTIMDRQEWKQLGESITTPLTHLILAEPNYMSNWGIALTEMMKGLAEVVIATDDLPKVLSSLFARYLPFVITLADGNQGTLSLSMGKHMVDGRTTLYVCHNRTCQLPVHTIDEAVDQIVRVS